MKIRKMLLFLKNLLLLPRILKLIKDMVDDSTPLLCILLISFKQRAVGFSVVIMPRHFKEGVRRVTGLKKISCM